jgi:hypothetical protein
VDTPHLLHRVRSTESEYFTAYLPSCYEKLSASAEDSDFHYFPAEQQGSEINRHLSHFLQRSILQNKEKSLPNFQNYKREPLHIQYSSVVISRFRSHPKGAQR